MKKILSAVAGIFLCGMILIGGRAAAEPVDAMTLFQETLMQTAGQRNFILHQDIFFVVPSAVGELDFIAGVERGKLGVAGECGFWMTSANGEYTEMEVPFYIGQSKDNLTLYYQTDKKWKKMTMPLTSADMAQILSAANAQDPLQQIEFVKEVSLLSDGESQRTFLVRLDGNKIADTLAQINPKANNDALKNNPFVQYIDRGIRNADCWYTWTVNKNTWQTVTLSANLSGLVQSIAKEMLNDPNSPSPAPLRELLETVAFYSEFKAYTTYLNPEAKSRLEIPKKALKAKEVESFTDDKKKK